MRTGTAALLAVVTLTAATGALGAPRAESALEPELMQGLEQAPIPELVKIGPDTPLAA